MAGAPAERVRNPRLRSIGALVAGFAVVFVLSTAMDGAMHATGVFPPQGVAMSTGLWLLATAYRVGFTVLGGYVTARLAPNNPVAHALALGILGTVIALIAAVATMFLAPPDGSFGPLWYPWLLVVTALPSTWAGAKLIRGA